MFRLPGAKGKDLCDSHLGASRRDFLRVGGASMLGMTLNQMLRAQAVSAESSKLVGGPGWGKAKSVIMVYLQGGPSHLDLWDPKENVPDNVRSQFKPIPTKIPGVNFTEVLPNLAKVNDKFTMIRSMSYTPNGLFNHTAAIYQIMTGYTTDKVSPSGQLEPPTPKGFPELWLEHHSSSSRPTSRCCRLSCCRVRLQESNVVNKGGTAGFLGKAFDPYYLFPAGDDMQMDKMSNIKVDDLQLRPDVFSARLRRRASLRQAISDQMPVIDKAVKDYNIDEFYNQALNLLVSGRARDAFDLSAEPEKLRDEYGRNTFGQSCLLARRLVEAGTRVWLKSSGRRSPIPTITHGITTLVSASV